jgi:UDP-N-acetylmuramyl pentapeptide phosphotransferase/UDP-N-acetylglucosamine-1-phosphate transferase
MLDMAGSVPTSAPRCYDCRVEITPLTTTPLFAFCACVLVHVAALYVFPRLGLLDTPERYGHKRLPLPYPTGVIAAFLFAGFLAIHGESTQDFGLLLSVLALTAVCFMDDRARLSPWVRLLLQGSVAFALFVTGTRIYTLTNPLADFGLGEFVKLDAWTVTLQGVGPLPVLSGLFTAAWIYLTVNALNWFDGVPGQTSLLSTVGFLTIGFLSLSSRVGQPELALVAFVLAGLAAGATLFELPSPLQRVVPGDSGAMFFGLLLGVLTIYAGGKVATGFLVLGVPLVDSVLVILQRVSAGTSPLKGSHGGEHLHHRLLAIGWSPWAVIALTVGLGAAFGVTALFLSTFGKFVAGAILAATIASLSTWSGFYARNRKR